MVSAAETQQDERTPTKRLFSSGAIVFGPSSARVRRAQTATNHKTARTGSNMSEICCRCGSMSWLCETVTNILDGQSKFSGQTKLLSCSPFQPRTCAWTNIFSLTQPSCQRCWPRASLQPPAWRARCAKRESHAAVVVTMRECGPASAAAPRLWALDLPYTLECPPCVSALFVRGFAARVAEFELRQQMVQRVSLCRNCWDRAGGRAPCVQHDGTCIQRYYRH